MSIEAPIGVPVQKSIEDLIEESGVRRDVKEYCDRLCLVPIVRPTGGGVVKETKPDRKNGKHVF